LKSAKEPRDVIVDWVERRLSINDDQQGDRPNPVGRLRTSRRRLWTCRRAPIATTIGRMAQVLGLSRLAAARTTFDASNPTLEGARQGDERSD